MEFNETRVRELVRETVARHLAASSSAPVHPHAGPSGHASHALYVLVNDADACLIEPSVTCNHCGYCRSHGY